MADRMTREQRHMCMSHIRSKDTKPEMAVRKGLFAAGFRYRLNVNALPGTPDIVLRKYHTVIFVNGCFWHGHPGCRLFSLPKTNRKFWEQKIARNRRRDAAVQARLEAHGWKVIVLWECELDPARHWCGEGREPVSRLDETLASLPERIRRCAAQYDNEQEQRRRQAVIRRQELAAASQRHAKIQEEIISRYNVPRKIVRASKDGID